MALRAGARRAPSCLSISSSFPAENQDKAVAIVLSGPGPTARGVRAVKEAGGLVLVKDEFTKFSGCPAAADTGVVDAAFSPGEMPGYLMAYETPGPGGDVSNWRKNSRASTPCSAC